MGRDLKVEFGRINDDNIEQVSAYIDGRYHSIHCDERPGGCVLSSAPSNHPVQIVLFFAVSFVCLPKIIYLFTHSFIL
jgi:hypothetical protein